ncbi:MAG: branched-chain amino acid ABC transporter permease [Actinomycetota bacterium]
MKDALIFGVIQGAVYGLLALGLVLVYKGARVFNFAQGEFGTIAAYLAWFLIDRRGVPYPVGAVLAVVAVGLLGFLVERLIVRPLFDAPRVTLLVATTGFALAAIQLQLIATGPNAQRLAPALSGKGLTFLGVIISPQQILLFVILAGLGAFMAYFFSRTDLGLAVLATSQEPVATELAGISTKRISSFIWTLAAVLGAIAGVLFAPTTGAFTPAFMTTTVLLPSFTAALVGGVTSLPGAFIGGQIVGITEKVGQYLNLEFDLGRFIVGVPTLMVFIVLVTILVVRPRGLLGSEA